ncbi:hypothetical protein [Criblamydia sequanensis]|uniref:Uncharacterized protein n=1 Tax=Candidatus Criblamydia sequanensis CRIB-18 TaxID=1437425 RepID=A0A090DVY9_9BACT|nr:hypothetical protein [Criblamydia sequanensis]CDR33104.1 hypothetical protein CSEC_0265 [Criblamydia sequanensis CRIB-18]
MQSSTEVQNRFPVSTPVAPQSVLKEGTSSDLARAFLSNARERAKAKPAASLIAKKAPKLMASQGDSAKPAVDAKVQPGKVKPKPKPRAALDQKFNNVSGYVSALLKRDETYSGKKKDKRYDDYEGLKSYEKALFQGVTLETAVQNYNAAIVDLQKCIEEPDFKNRDQVYAYIEKFQGTVNKIVERIAKKNGETSSRVSLSELKSFSLNDPIPCNHERKFICKAMSRMTPKPVKEAGVLSQKWASEAKRDEVKALKKELKEKLSRSILDTINGPFVEKANSKAGILETMKAPFEKLLASLSIKSDLHLHKNMGSLKEAIELMDSLYKYDGYFSKDEEFQKLYFEIARAGGLYHKSEDAIRKSQKLGPFEPVSIPQDDLETIPKLIKFLEKVSAFFDQKIEEAEKETESSPTVVIPQAEERVKEYFQELVKMHKSLSYSRFTGLFDIHERFLKRINFGVSLLGDEKTEAREMLSRFLSPEVTLLETTKHRYHQGRHDRDKEKRAVYNHRHLQDISSIVKMATLGTHDFNKYECSHVVPFPGLFTRRDDVIYGDKNLATLSQLTHHHVSQAHMEKGAEEREEEIRKDIEKIFQIHGKNPESYVSNLIDLLLRLSLEESSSTIHLPSAFNQEVDGASEKYVAFGEGDEEAKAYYKSFKAQEESEGKEKEAPPSLGDYTDKIYKYMLATDMYKMIRQDKTDWALKDVVEEERNYIEGVKNSLAEKVLGFSKLPLTIPNAMLALSFINVFFGVKNAEAKAGLDFQENEDKFFKAVEALKANWDL